MLPPAMQRLRLLLMSMFSARPFGVFFRIFVEGLLAAVRAKMIGLVLVIALVGSGLGVNVHAANGVYYFYHRCFPFE
jgi:hypothetical protein